MTLYIIGIGLNDEKDISVKGLEAVKTCDAVYLEGYTSKLACTIEDMEKLYGNKVRVVEREFVENSENVLKGAKDGNVALLIIGDSLSATTHVEMMSDAKKAGIDVKIIHNASILTAVAVTGLQLYKFGRTASIPFPEENWLPETPYDVLKDNLSLGLHTLMLLDLRPFEKDEDGNDGRYMTVNQALKNMLEIEKKRGEKIFIEDLLVMGCARMGSDSPTIISGKVSELIEADFQGPPHCLVVPGKMHFMEEDIVETFKK